MSDTFYVYRIFLYQMNKIK